MLLPNRDVVSKTRSAEAILFLLQLDHSGWCLWRPPCRCYWEDGRYPRLQRLEMGIIVLCSVGPNNQLTIKSQIFILEGLLSCVVSFFLFFIMSDFPEDAKWLTEPERSYIKARLEVDQGKSALERPITFKDIVNCFKDFKIFLGGFMYFGLIVPAYGYAYFAPSIIQTCE